MTQTSASRPAKRSTRTWYDDLFFNRRRPHLRAIPMEWQKPHDDEYQRLIHADGFISPKYWIEDDLNRYPTIKQDAEDLVEYLLPTYFEYSQKSKYYQDRFYFYQWVLIQGIFLTTFLSILALISFQLNIMIFNSISLKNILIVLALIYCTPTAFFGSLSYSGDPQANWGKTRKLSELLRAIYYKYLSHIYPFDREDRLEKLREQILAIRLAEKGRQTNTTILNFAQKEKIKRKPHEIVEYPILWKIYTEGRIEAESSFYESRVRENKSNTSFTFTMSVLLITISSIFIAVSLFDVEPKFLLLASVFTTFAGMLVTFRHLYGWERQADIYSDAIAGFEKIRQMWVDPNDIEPDLLAKYYSVLVLESENVIANQVNQWGAIEGSVIQSQPANLITVEPMFGPPPLQRQFKCDIFMIMPFSIASLQPIYAEHIKPAMHELEIDIKRGDDFFSKHAIMDEVWAGIYHSKIVICECTGRNANVFYEIGIAHTIGKPAIMIAQTIDDVPFDLRHLRTIIYDNTPEGMQVLRTQLKDAVSRLLPLGTLLQSQSKL